MTPKIETLVAKYLADPAVAWSLGSFGAIAEFMWRAEEPAETGRGFRVTAGGGIRIDGPNAMEAVAYTTPSRDPARRRGGIAFCLPAGRCAAGRRTTITEVGADADALRPQDRDAILFDVGLGQLQVDVMVRTKDPETLTLLRAAAGQALFDPAQTLMAHLPRLSPHRVFVTHCGRIEVFSDIPAPDGRSPDGPHTHVLPKLLKTGRTHAANIEIPDGLVPCLYIHLARPDPDHALRTDDEEHA